MARVSVIPPDKARAVAPPPDCAGLAQATAYLDGERSPLHLHLHEIAATRMLLIERNAVDRVIHVWRGSVLASGHPLAEGSSIIVEHGRSVAIEGVATSSLVLLFAAADGAAQSRDGGHVHLLPVERVPRMKPAEGSPVTGGMHANSECPTCQVWLHENTFAAQTAASAEDEARGVHSHTEDEIIFVTDGQIRLGGKLYGPGTALAIAANTLYSFTAGPEGLRFVNFRSAAPGDISFANGGSMNERQYWRERLAQPEYLEG